MSEDRLEATMAARETFYRTLGALDEDVWFPLLNPTFQGGPKWPAFRQGWRTIRHKKNTIMVSDGLSDPFEDEPDSSIGFGVEILAETPDEIGEQVSASWLFHLVYQVSQNAAHHGGFRQAIEQYGIFTMEIASAGWLDEHQNEEGQVGLLLGLNPPTLPVEAELPGGTLRLITVKLLTSPELQYVYEHKQEGRERLCSRFKHDGSYHISSLERKSVV